MKDNITRILIESAVRKALKDSEESPERSARNLVEIGLEMSKGRFQQYFIGMIHEMLQQGEGPYYSLIKDVLSHVDHEIILNFGMNIGYNSCTIGARKIRETEAEQHFNIPWALSFYLNTGEYGKYHDIINQGKNLGIFTYFLYGNHADTDVFELIRKNRDCAFLLIWDDAGIDGRFIKNAKKFTNIMICVQDHGRSAEACQLLRQSRLLYSVCVTCSLKESTEEQINKKIEGILPQKPSFLFLKSTDDCSNEICQKNYFHIKKIRNDQIYPVLAVDTVYDSIWIDSVISEEGINVEFLEDGRLKTQSKIYTEKEYNIFQNSLSDILELALPKT